MTHAVKMLLGCLLPLLLIFLLPLFGIGEGVSLFVFVVLMFVCHLLMMGGHYGASAGEQRATQHQGENHVHP